MKRLSLVSLSLILVALLVLGCTQPAPSPSPAPTTKPTATPAPTPTTAPTTKPSAPATIKIGSAFPITGARAGGGVEVKQGYEIGIEHINRAGGIMVKEFGKQIPLELVMLDDESDPLKTVARLESIRTQQQVVAFLGGAGSPLHVAAAAAAEKLKVPYLGVGFTVYGPHALGYKYLFSPFNKTPQIIKVTFDLLATLPAAERPTKIALFNIANDWGIEQADIIRKTAPKDYKIVMDKEYAADAKDFSSLVLAAKTAGADSIFSTPPPPQGVAMWKQMKELDWSPRFAFIEAAPVLDAWTKSLGADGDYVVTEGSYHWSYTYPKNKEFAADFEKKFNIKPTAVSGASYVSVQVLADAIERAGVLDKDKIRDALQATNMTTVMGQLTFNPDGTANFPIGLVQWQKGKQEQIWPEKNRTQPLIYPTPKWSERK